MVGLDSYNATASIHYTPFDFPGNLQDLESTIQRSSPVPFKDSSSFELYEDEDLLTQYRGSLPGTLPSPVSHSELEIDEALPFIPNTAGNADDRQRPLFLHPEYPVDQINRASSAKPSTNLKETIDILVEQNDDIAAARSRVQELRLILRYKRDEEGQLRAALMKRLRMLFLQDGAQNIKPLLQEFEHLELAAETSLGLERNFQEAEDDLVQQEYALLKSMRRLSDILNRGSSHPVLKENLEMENGDLDDTSSIDSMEQNLPPSVVEYLSRVGDVRLLQEQLSGLDSSWLAISDKKTQRQHLGISMDDESQEFLRTYSEKRNQMRKEMNDVLLDVGRLRAICEEQGVLTDEYTGGVDIIHELSLDCLVREAEDPLKTSALEDRSPFFEPETSAPFSRTAFINKWILHQLRHSAIEIRRLKSLPELQMLWEEGCDEMSISRLALTVWYTDDTAILSPRTSSQLEYYTEDQDILDPLIELDGDPDRQTMDYSIFRRSNSVPYPDQPYRTNPIYHRSLSVT
ncbi:hypothetical protein AWENTII_007032 [Aspergillus wentii]